MAVGPDLFPTMHPIKGISLGTTCAGIKKPGRKDLVVIEIASGSSVAGVFTRNAFCAAPVVIAKQHLQQQSPAYFLINTGNANAGTGEQGLRDAQYCCEALAREVDAEPESVLPFSTGVIGEPLPVDIISAALPAACEQLSQDGWADAAEGILTTDTRPKGASLSFEYQGQRISVTGISKGSGMIRPDMATMLAFVATDAAVSQPLLQQILTDATDRSFNRITVDGDTSTNDACMLIATGQAEVEQITDVGSELYRLLSETVTAVCIELAQAIIRDGEGATKFVTVQVNGGQNEQECLQVAYTIAHSPLVKTALFASDPNWGRILAAVGRAGLENLDVTKVSIFLDQVCIVDKGGLAADYTEEQGQAVMDLEEITIRVELDRGVASDAVWTSDLSHDYVSINADYRS